MAEANISEIKELFHNLNQDICLITTMLSRVRSAVTMAECTVIEINNIVNENSNDTESEIDDVMY